MTALPLDPPSLGDRHRHTEILRFDSGAVEFARTKSIEPSPLATTPEARGAGTSGISPSCTRPTEAAPGSDQVTGLSVAFPGPPFLAGLTDQSKNSRIPALAHRHRSPGRPEWSKPKAGYDEGLEIPDDTWRRYLDAPSELDEVEREIDLNAEGRAVVAVSPKRPGHGAGNITVVTEEPPTGLVLRLNGVSRRMSFSQPPDRSVALGPAAFAHRCRPGVAALNDRCSPFAMFCPRLAQRPLRADSACKRGPDRNRQRRRRASKRPEGFPGHL